MSKYKAGRRIEYKAIKYLEQCGYECTRAAGSKGVFDIVAIRSDVIRLIQIKSERKSTSYNKDIEQVVDMDVPEICTKELWVYQYRKGWSDVYMQIGSIVNTQLELPESTEGVSLFVLEEK